MDCTRNRFGWEKKQKIKIKQNPRQKKKKSLDW